MRSELIYDLLAIVALSLVAFAYVTHLLVRPGLISGFDWSFPPESFHWGEFLNGVRYAWTHVGIFTGASSTFLGAVGNWILPGYFLSEAGLSPETYSKVTLLTAIIIAGVASYFLLRFSRLSRIASVMGGALYMSTPIFFDWISLTGMSAIGSVYALFPLMFYLFFKSLLNNRQRFVYVILTAFAVVGLYPIFGIYLSFMFLLPYSLFAIFFSSTRKKTLTLIVSSLLPIFILSILLQTFWLAVAIQTGQASQPGGYTALNWPIASFNLIDVERLFVSYLPAYKNVVSSNSVLVAISFIIPAFSYTALLGKKSGLNIFYAIMATSLTLFLVSPLSTQLIRDNFLLLGIFKDKSKLLVPIALSYSGLFGSAIDSVISALDDYRLKVLFISAVLVLEALYASPYLTSLGRSSFGNVSFPNSYTEVARYVLENSADSKVLWLPVGGNQVRIAGESSVPWTIDFYSILSPSGLTVLSERYMNIPQFWLSNLFYSSRGYSIAKIAGFFNIKYIVDRRDIAFVNWGTTLDSPIWDRKFDFSQVLNQSGFQKEVDLGNIAVYRNDFVQPKVFSAESLAVATGGLNLLGILANSEDHIMYNNTVVMFISQLSDMSIYDIADTIILDNNDFIDLVLPLLTSSKVVDSGEYGGLSTINGWARLHQWRWDDVLQENLEDIALIEDGVGTLTIPVTITKQDDYAVWAKVLTGPRSSTLQFTLWGGPADFPITFSANTRTSAQEALGWLRLDNASRNATFNLKAGNYFLNVTSVQGRNALARIVFTPKSNFENAMSQLTSILSRKRIILIEDSNIANKSNASSFKVGPLIIFQEINPSMYKVQIVNSTKPFFLIFLETYDPDWKLFLGQDEPLDSRHFPVFGYANAWYVEKTGSYELTIKFSSQTTLDIGMAISLTTFGLCVGYIGLFSFISFLRLIIKKARNRRLEMQQSERNN